MMHRTQVYFDLETLELLREEAREKKTTLASIIRDKVKKTVKKRTIAKRKRTEKKDAYYVLNDLEKLAKKLKVKGPKDLSQRIDEFVYNT